MYIHINDINFVSISLLLTHETQEMKIKGCLSSLLYLQHLANTAAQEALNTHRLNQWKNHPVRGQQILLAGWKDRQKAGQKEEGWMHDISSKDASFLQLRLLPVFRKLSRK